MTQNGLKWLFSVIFRKSIRVHVTRLQMASSLQGRIWVPWDVYDHKTPLGARFQLYARIGGIFKEAKRPLKTPWKRAFWVKTSVFALKKYIFFVKSENHSMYPSLQPFFWLFLKPQIWADKKTSLIIFLLAHKNFGGVVTIPPYLCDSVIYINKKRLRALCALNFFYFFYFLRGSRSTQKQYSEALNRRF